MSKYKDAGQWRRIGDCADVIEQSYRRGFIDKPELSKLLTYLKAAAAGDETEIILLEASVKPTQDKVHKLKWQNYIA